MNTSITRTGALTPDQLEAVENLVEAVGRADGVRPLNETAHFSLSGHGHAVHWLALQGSRLVGYGQTDRASHSMQLLVSPDMRRQGIGRALAEQMRQVEPKGSWWAFGNLAGAQHLAAQLGMGLERELLIMERDLVAHPVDATQLPPPEQVEIRGFTPADEDALLELNADAFADHPEQGDMTLEDFTVRSQEDWFDPEGLLLATDEDTGARLGFHWTKTEPMDPARPDELIGEVYVIGVRPDQGGRGVGRALLAAGLEHLAGKGVRRVRLYVEASSERVVRMYQAASFEVVSRDASYTPQA